MAQLRPEGLQAALLCIRFQAEVQKLWLEEFTFNQHYELQTAVKVVNNSSLMIKGSTLREEVK